MPVQKHLAAQAIDAFLRALGRDPDREPDLRGTAKRVADAWADELLDGYGVDVPAMLHADAIDCTSAAPAVGATGVPPLARSATDAPVCASARTNADQGLLIVRGISVATICPHHLLPALGTADVVYRPGRNLLGLGVIPRLVQAWSHRLTLQESIGQNVVRSLVEYADVRGAACRLSLSHTCMSARGARQTGSVVETVAFAGSLDEGGGDRELALAALDGLRVARTNMG